MLSGAMSMKNRPSTLVACAMFAASALAAPACGTPEKEDDDRYEDSPIAEATEELKEAAEDRDRGDVEDLREEFKEAKTKLASLREQIARADEGVTEEMMEARRELKEVMRQEMKHVRKEIAEAEAAARAYNALNDEAAALLDETAPPRVNAEVEVRLRELPAQAGIESSKKVERIEYETNRVERAKREGDAKKTTKPTAAKADSQPTAASN